MDPVSGGIGQAAKQMMQEMQRQQAEVAQQQSQGVDKAQFAQQVQGPQDVQNVQQMQQVQEAGKTQTAMNASNVLRAAQSGDVSRLGVKPIEAAGNTKKSGFTRLIDQISGGQNKLEKIIKMASSGKTYNAQQLLAIQAGVYKFSQELELTSKVVEKATSGIKQTMQTQV